MIPGTVGPRCTCCRGTRSVVLPGDVLVCPTCDGDPPNKPAAPTSETC